MTLQHDTDRPPALRLSPFHGMRYNAAVVGDLGAVTSPPYDVLDRPTIESLLHQHSRNVVRLILPRMVSDPVSAEDPYDRAAHLMNRWRTKHVLTSDDEPGLYVYEYGTADYTVCGLIGAVDLSERGERVILPHEEVIDRVVADRLALMTASQANLEPILLVYDSNGDGAASAAISKARSQPPITDVTAEDGSVHRLWVLSDPEEIRRIAEALAPHQALIADGHHRYATYLQLQRRHRQRGEGAGPWDRGLALLVDQSQCPLRLEAIHRSVSELSLSGVEVPAGFEVSAPVDLAAHETPAPPDSTRSFVLTDGRRQRLIRATGRLGVTDAELLHEQLLPAWGITEDRLGYHHTVGQTLRTAEQDGGVAVLMHPTTVTEVMDIARAGKIMPRKSTSFGPKPRMGLVMRSFDDELTAAAAVRTPER